MKSPIKAIRGMNDICLLKHLYGGTLKPFYVILYIVSDTKIRLPIVEKTNYSNVPGEATILSKRNVRSQIVT